jgi:hypothetical protein
MEKTWSFPELLQTCPGGEVKVDKLGCHNPRFGGAGDEAVRTDSASVFGLGNRDRALPGEHVIEHHVARMNRVEFFRSDGGSLDGRLVKRALPERADSEFVVKLPDDGLDSPPYKGSHFTHRLEGNALGQSEEGLQQHGTLGTLGFLTETLRLINLGGQSIDALDQSSLLGFGGERKVDTCQRIEVQSLSNRSCRFRVDCLKPSPLLQE